MRNPSEDIRLAIATQLYRSGDELLRRTLDAWNRDNSNEDRMVVMQAAFMLQTTKFWLLKEAVERLLLRLPNLQPDFEGSFGYGGDCPEEKRLSRLSYRTAEKLFFHLETQPSDSPRSELISGWNKSATDLAYCDEADFSLSEDLQVEACRFHLSIYVRDCLVLENLPSDSDLLQ